MTKHALLEKALTRLTERYTGDGSGFDEPAVVCAGDAVDAAVLTDGDLRAALRQYHSMLKLTGVITVLLLMAFPAIGQNGLSVEPSPFDSSKHVVRDATTGAPLLEVRPDPWGRSDHQRIDDYATGDGNWHDVGPNPYTGQPDSWVTDKNGR